MSDCGRLQSDKRLAKWDLLMSSLSMSRISSISTSTASVCNWREGRRERDKEMLNISGNPHLIGEGRRMYWPSISWLDACATSTIRPPTTKSTDTSTGTNYSRNTPIMCVAQFNLIPSRHWLLVEDVSLSQLDLNNSSKSPIGMIYRCLLRSLLLLMRT